MPIIKKKNTMVKSEDIIETNTNTNVIENEEGEGKKTMNKKIIKKTVKPTEEEIVERDEEMLEEEDVAEDIDIEEDDSSEEDIDVTEDDSSEEDIDIEEESDSEDEDDDEEDDEEDFEDEDDDDDEEDDEEDSEDEDDDEEDDEDDRFNEIVESIKAIVNDNKEKPDGPSRGRRLKEKFSNVKASKLKAVKSANKEENLNSLVAALEENGMGFVFSGLKFATEKRAVAARILASLESAIIDCLYKKGTGFGIFNTRFELGIVDGKVYPALNNERVSTKYDVLKKAHTTIKMNPAEIDTNVGLIYKNDGKSELSIPGKAQKDGSFIVEDENFFYKKGTVLDSNGLPVEKSASSTKKKVVKKKK